MARASVLQTAALSGLVFALGSISFLPDAEAARYCRSTSCGEPACSGEFGEAPEPSCPPLRWERTCVGVSLQAQGSRFFPNETTTELVRAAFAAWTEAECAGGGTPRLLALDLGPVACDALEYNRTAGNANVVIFRDSVWPHGGFDSEHLGLTTVTFDTKTGEILDADVEINTSINSVEGTPTDEGRRVTIGDQNPDFDLLSILTHEAGHFLGLGHDPLDDEGESGPDTMTPSYGGRDDPDNLALRTLAQDDVDAICAVYDPEEGPPVTECDNPIPRHGFSPACVAAQTEGNCALASSGLAGRGGALAALASLVALAWRGRRTRSRARGSGIRGRGGSRGR